METRNAEEIRLVFVLLDQNQPPDTRKTGSQPRDGHGRPKDKKMGVKKKRKEARPAMIRFLQYTFLCRRSGSLTRELVKCFSLLRHFEPNGVAHWSLDAARMALDLHKKSD